jgi:hypothetical protein
VATGTQQQTIDTGDVVLHLPSNENWTVACVDGEYLSWCGWPEGEARLSDCVLIEKSTPEYRQELLQQLAQMDGSDHRGRHARAILGGAV